MEVWSSKIFFWKVFFCLACVEAVSSCLCVMRAHQRGIPRCVRAL